MAPSFRAPSTCIGSLQCPSAWRSTYQRLVPANVWPSIEAVTGASPACTGRLETKYRRLPSGAKAGSESCHCPENDATSGADQPLPRRCETSMVSSVSAKSERMKYNVWPSGENAAVVSCMPVETTPGPSNSAAFTDPMKPRANADAQTIARNFIRGSPLNEGRYDPPS